MNAGLPIGPCEAASERESYEALAVAATHDQYAFAVLYHRYTPRIHRYVLARIHNSSDIEDIVSDIWIRAYSRMHLFRPDKGSFAAWLFTLARHVLYNAVRQRARAEVTVIVDFVEQGVDPQAQFLNQETDAEMRLALSRLTVDQQEALALRYAADLSFAEVGRALGKSEAAAKMLVRRGIERLRTELAKEIDDESRP